MTGHFTSYETRTNHELATPGMPRVVSAGDRAHTDRMEQLPGLPAAAFDKEDGSPDAAFYAFPRFVTHIDAGAVAAVTQLYRESLPAGGAVLDLMSSWVSH